MILSSYNLHLLPYDPAQWQQLASWYYDVQNQGMFRHHPRAMRPDEFQNYPKLIGGEVFFAYERNNQKPIGFVQLIPDSKTNRAFYLGMLIDPQFRNQRYTNELTVIALDYAFNRCGYQKAIIEVLEDNENLKKTLTSVGFLKEGTLLKEAFQNGKFVNELRYCMFSEFFNKNKDKALEARELWAASLKPAQQRPAVH